MIRKLQLKFVVVCMTLVMVVLGVVLVSIFLSARQNLEVISHQVLQRVIRQATAPPPPSSRTWGWTSAARKWCCPISP